MLVKLILDRRHPENLEIEKLKQKKKRKGSGGFFASFSEEDEDDIFK